MRKQSYPRYPRDFTKIVHYHPSTHYRQSLRLRFHITDDTLPPTECTLKHLLKLNVSFFKSILQDFPFRNSNKINKFDFIRNPRFQKCKSIKYNIYSYLKRTPIYNRVLNTLQFKYYYIYISINLKSILTNNLQQIY